MKISIFLRWTIPTLFICCFSAIAQDSTQFSLPEGAIARLGKGRLGKIHFSPDGNRLAVSSSNKTRLTAHTDIVSVQYSPDGQTLATRSTDGTVLLWKIKPTWEDEDE